jgi:hypothetical protein
VLGLLWLWSSILKFARVAELAERLATRARELSTAEISSGNFLFLRVAGDEAAAALGSFQFGSWLLSASRRRLLAISSFFESHTFLGRMLNNGYLLTLSMVAAAFALPRVGDAIRESVRHGENLLPALLDHPVATGAVLIATLFTIPGFLAMAITLIVLVLWLLVGACNGAVWLHVSDRAAV